MLTSETITQISTDPGKQSSLFFSSGHSFASATMCEFVSIRLHLSSLLLPPVFLTFLPLLSAAHSSVFQTFFACESHLLHPDHADKEINAEPVFLSCCFTYLEGHTISGIEKFQSHVLKEAPVRHLLARFLRQEPMHPHHHL